MSKSGFDSNNVISIETKMPYFEFIICANYNQPLMNSMKWPASTNKKNHRKGGLIIWWMAGT